jgi:putative transposase
MAAREALGKRNHRPVAALDVATGAVIAKCKPRHRQQGGLSFLRRIDKEVPPELEVNLIVDNYCTHKHAKVRTWLTRQPRVHDHFTSPHTPPGSTRRRMWFGIITQRAIRRRSFSSVREIVTKIEHFIANYSRGSAPFSLTATTD